MPIKETLRLAEVRTYTNLVLILAMLAIFIISINPVEADDTESIWQSLSERGQIELTLDDSYLESNNMFGDVEQQVNPEQVTTTLNINIPNTAVVRRLSDGQENEFFRSGEFDVIGWFNSDGTSFEGFGDGIVLVIDGVAGGYGVFASEVTETDGSGVTDAEAATTQPYGEDDEGDIVPIEPDPDTITTPEAIVNNPTINITDNINVRNTSGLNTGRTNNNFPRGEATVIGIFEADADDIFGRTAIGTWYVVVAESGTEGAVFANSFNNVTDVQEAALPVYTITNSNLSAPVEVEPTDVPEVEPEAAPEPDDETVVTPEPIVTPESNLGFPELPSSMEVSYYAYGDRNDDVVTTETLNINSESFLPFPLGMIEQGASEQTDRVGWWGEPNPERNRWQKIPLAGIVVNVETITEGSRQFNFIHLLTQTPDGQNVIIQIRLHDHTRFSPVNDELQNMASDDVMAMLWESNGVIYDDLIQAPTRNITPGDYIIIDIENVGEQSNTPNGTNWMVNQSNNNIPDGTPTAVFESIDDGEVDREIPVIQVFGGNRILFNQD
ncbi:MAG: hypothetical protein OEX81_00230 [Candidatus Pacebacteria bacterium]|nr:hypothetical protein [Candidatus Paceibacterota bacterium]